MILIQDELLPFHVTRKFGDVRCEYAQRSAIVEARLEPLWSEPLEEAGGIWALIDTGFSYSIAIGPAQFRMMADLPLEAFPLLRVTRVSTAQGAKRGELRQGVLWIRHRERRRGLTPWVKLPLTEGFLVYPEVDPPCPHLGTLALRDEMLDVRFEFSVRAFVIETAP